MQLNPQPGDVCLNSRVIVAGLAARPAQRHLPGIVAHVGIACNGIGHILGEGMAVDVVDNDVTKLNFNGFPVTDGTGGRRNHQERRT